MNNIPITIYTSSNNLINYKEIELYPLAKEVYINNNLLELSRIEYLLLETLIQHPHQIFSVQYLFDHCWPIDSNSLDSTVKTHLCWLRRKINDYSHYQYIINVKSFGYKLDSIK